MTQRPIPPAPAPVWQRSPMRVSFEPHGEPKQTLAIRGPMAGIISEEEDKESDGNRYQTSVACDFRTPEVAHAYFVSVSRRLHSRHLLGHDFLFHFGAGHQNHRQH